MTDGPEELIERLLPIESNSLDRPKAVCSGSQLSNGLVARERARGTGVAPDAGRDGRDDIAPMHVQQTARRRHQIKDSYDVMPARRAIASKTFRCSCPCGSTDRCRRCEDAAIASLVGVRLGPGIAPAAI
jgi:hypothetical protein